MRTLFNQKSYKLWKYFEKKSSVTKYTTKVKYEKQILIWEQPAVYNITSGIQKEQMSQLFYKDWTDDQLKFLVTKVW